MGQSLTEINFATVIVQKDEILPIWHVFTCPCCKWTCLTQFYCKKKNCYLIKTHWLITFQAVTLSALPLWSNDYKARKGLPPLAWSRPVWWLFVKEVKASAKRFWFLFLFSHFSKSLPLIFTRSRSFVFLGKHFIDPKNTRLACLYSRGQLATFFFTDYTIFTCLPKFVMIEETKLRFESFDKFNGLLDISEQSNHERIYTKTCPSISEPQIIITHSLDPLITIVSQVPRPTPLKEG